MVFHQLITSVVLLLLMLFKVCTDVAGERWRRKTGVHHSSRWLLCTTFFTALSLLHHTVIILLIFPTVSPLCYRFFLSVCQIIDCVETAKISSNVFTAISTPRQFQPICAYTLKRYMTETYYRAVIGSHIGRPGSVSMTLSDC